MPPKKKRKKVTDKTIQHLVLNSKTTRWNLTKIRERRFRNSSKLETVQIHKNSGINCIGEEAFENCTSLWSVHLAGSIEKIEFGAFAGCSSLQSIHLELDGVTATSIGNNVFEGCTSLQSFTIPNDVSVTTIGWRAFALCKSLKSFTIPHGITTIGRGTFDSCISLFSVCIPDSDDGVVSATINEIEDWAFENCTSLQSIYVPNTVKTIGHAAFYNCNTLQLRQTNGTNYHPNINTWLRRRFDNLPIHRACYYANDDTESAINNLSTIIRDNAQTLAVTDTGAMGMTPLHILCCNPHITAEMAQIIVENDSSSSSSPSSSSSILGHTDVTDSTPLQLFLKCTCTSLLEDHEQEELLLPQTMSSLSSTAFLEMGISGKDLAILLVLNDNQDFVTSWRTQDDSTNLFPFMTAVTLSSCGLDVVYTLAMKTLDVIV